jgi:hypothetical protein
MQYYACSKDYYMILSSFIRDPYKAFIFYFSPDICDNKFIFLNSQNGTSKILFLPINSLWRYFHFSSSQLFQIVCNTVFVDSGHENGMINDYLLGYGVMAIVLGHS